MRNCNNIEIDYVPPPTGSGDPMLLPGSFAPVQPLSIGLSFVLRKVPILLLISISFFSLSGSSGNLCCSTSSLPLIIGADKPGHSIFTFPKRLCYTRTTNGKHENLHTCSDHLAPI